MRRRIPALAIVVALGLRCEPPACADWPMFIGDGDRTPAKTGQALVAHLDDAPISWTLKHHTGVGKGLYPGHLRLSREHGIEPFYGGASSPIVADGMVYVTYFKPDGKVPAAVRPWRTVDDPRELLPPWFFSVTADDVLLAVDARTGRVRWENVERGKGLNRLGHKRGHWCVSPAYADGCVYSMGTAGWLYAYDARTGRKLWETLAEPGLQRLREEYLESKELCWKASEKSSLVVAGGAVVVPHEGLTAFDAKTGQQRWAINQRVLSGHATPAIWRNAGRDYLLAGDARGNLRLIDAQNGEILWVQDGLEEQLGTLNLTGDLVVLNAGSQSADNKKQNGLLGVYRLSAAGIRRLWTLPDEPPHRHSWTLDRGAERRVAMQDGNVYLITGVQANRLVVAEAESGRLLFDQLVPGAHAPYLMEDRLLLYHDRAHTDPVRASWWSLADKNRPVPLHGSTGFGPRTITGYEVPIQWPYVGGFLYARTLDGLVCCDLREPEATPGNQTLLATIPAAIAGSRVDLHATFTQRDGHLTHGGLRESRRLHAIDTSKAVWDGRRLSGGIGIDVDGYRRFDPLEIDAVADKNGRLTGTIRSTLDAFGSPIPRSGKITALPREPHWMPPCTHVLQLDKAAIQQGGREGRLLLYLTVQAGQLERVEAFANQTTQARPVLVTNELTLADGRLTGTIKVRFRADEWAQPLTQSGDSAAGEYTIDARLAASGEVGEYRGNYGVKWLQSVPLGKARVEHPRSTP